MATDIWTDVSPPRQTGGFGGIAIDVAHPQTLLVTTIDLWYLAEVYRTTDGGAHWTAIGRAGTRSVASAEWLWWHGSSAAAEMGWMGDVELDPFDPSARSTSPGRASGRPRRHGRRPRRALAVRRRRPRGDRGARSRQPAVGSGAAHGAGGHRGVPSRRPRRVAPRRHVREPHLRQHEQPRLRRKQSEHRRRAWARTRRRAARAVPTRWTAAGPGRRLRALPKAPPRRRRPRVPARDRSRCRRTA